MEMSPEEFEKHMVIHMTQDLLRKQYDDPIQNTKNPRESQKKVLLGEPSAQQDMMYDQLNDA